MEEFIFDENELSDLLLPYQKNIFDTLIEKYGEEGAIKIWLSPNNSQIVMFGGDSNESHTYYDKVTDEIRKFICGDDKYADEREKIRLYTERTAKYVVITLAAILGDLFGTASAILVPVIVIILKSISKIGLNAWCAV